MEFEWDLRKRSLNLRKHGVAFEEAVELFRGPILEVSNDYLHEAEHRFVVHGEARGSVIVVVYTLRAEKGRIISARKASKSEREEYYRAIYSG